MRAVGDKVAPASIEGGPKHIYSPSWLALAAAVLDCDVANFEKHAETTSFTALGGTSLRAVEFTALLVRHHGCEIGVARLLEPRPLAEVLADARPVAQPLVTAPQPISDQRDLARLQQAMLFSEQLYGGQAFHLLFSADIRGSLDSERLRLVLAQITCRHESLRTVFFQADDGALRRRVLAEWKPVVIEQQLPHPGMDAVAAVHALLQVSSGTLLRPFEHPPIVFVLTLVDSRQSILSIVVHHAIVDGWSVGLLWREIATGYAGGTHDTGVTSIESLVAAEQSRSAAAKAQLRATAFSDIPTVAAIPSDLARPLRQDRAGARLLFGLSDAALRGCAVLAERSELTRNMVLFAVWALVVGRRAAAPNLVIGLASAGRTTVESFDVVGPYVKQLPVACQLTDLGSVLDYLRSAAAAVRDTLDAVAVPIEDIVAELGLGGDETRNPLVQVAFAAHDELVPETLAAGELTMQLHEGYCGGTVYDAVLYVQSWGESPRLALEYATSVLRTDEVVDLAGAVDQTLVEMATAPEGSLADVRTMTEPQRLRLSSWGAGPEVDAGGGLWQLIEMTAGRTPDAVAVRDATGSLTYRQLLRAARAQSSALAAAGVTANCGVGLAVRRSALEIVAILGTLRLGAAYTGIEPGIPDATAQTMLNAADVMVVLADDARLATLGADWHGRPVLPIVNPSSALADTERGDSTGPSHDLMPAPPDPARVAYVAFTSGSTGVPKGTRVPHRGVVRMVREPDYLLPGAGDRFMRLAPLGFDASTMEIFVPLVAGGTIEVFDDEHVTPDRLAEFLAERAVTGVWLTAGLFRLVADYRSDAFRGVHQVLTGGDVVPPAQVARVLLKNPGLRITNGYGPTENTTFTTVHHVDDPAQVSDPLPIGRPIAGTGVAVLDPAGRLVPPGGIGELFTFGAGLALGYAGRPDETARAFSHFSPDLNHLMYRTGDVVRWDRQGRLRFLGRRDGQVKIRGFRIELEAVARALREFPGVQDVAVVPTVSGTADRRLVAGIVPNAELTVAAIRSFATERLPGYAVPSLWAVVAELPVTRNGKLDVARLQELAMLSPDFDASDSYRPDVSISANSDGPVAEAIRRAWSAVLGSNGFRSDQRFFDVGGDSLQLLRVAASLRRDLPAYGVTIQDLYACQTITALSDRLRVRR